MLLIATCMTLSTAQAAPPACSQTNAAKPGERIAALHLCAARGNAAEAVDAWRQLKRQFPEYPRMLDIEEAIEDKLPGQASNQEIIGIFSRHHPRLPSSLELITNALITSNNDRAAEIARTFLREGHAIGLGRFDQIAQRSGATIHAEDYLARFRVLANKKRYDEARAVSKRLAASCQNDALAYLQCRAGKGSCNPDGRQCLAADFAIREAYLIDKTGDMANLARFVKKHISLAPGMWSSQHKSLPFIVARGLIEGKQTKAAVDFTAPAAKFGHDDAEAIWLHGYALLRLANEPLEAAKIFQKFASSVSSPISVARGLYWMGEALDVGGDKNGAQLAWTEGSSHWSTFYGQESGRKLGLKELPVTKVSQPGNPEGAMRDYIEAVHALIDIYDEKGLAFRVISDLARIAGPKDLYALADAGEKAGGIFFRVLTGRRLAFYNKVERELAFPMPPLPKTGTLPTHLTYGIIRQESAFKQDAVSRANAIGLMQIIPATGKRFGARKKELYDPVRSIETGTKIMNKLLGDYDGNLVFAMGGYNAGPGNVNKWIKRFGLGNREWMADWIEMIPFSETRGYVQRIPSGTRIYKGYDRNVVVLDKIDDLAQ